MASPILPTASSLVTPAIDEIVALRPESLPHFNLGSGRWADLPAMWRAQILLNLARMSDEVTSRRLRFSVGDALRMLASSEFNTTLPSEPQTALATVFLSRPNPSPANAPAGVIKAGTQFRKQAQPDGIPLPATSPPGNAWPLPIASATYVSRSTIYVPEDRGFPGDAFAIPCVATSPGAAANIPSFAGQYATGGNTQVQPSAPLFDPTFSVVDCIASGGSSGLPDPVLRAAAAAYVLGQYGPTDGAVIAGCLRQRSVRHMALLGANAQVPYARIYVADESWASGGPPSSSARPGWIAQVAQAVSDSWVGFGCRLRWGQVANLSVAVQPTIRLKTTDDLAFTDDIEQSVQAAVQAYFDDRPDWYRWRAANLQTLLSRADSRILYCSGVTVTDTATGASAPEPANTFGLTVTPVLTHLDPTTVSTAYLPPN